MNECSQRAATRGPENGKPHPGIGQSVPVNTMDPVVDWLLDSDPAIRWQVMRDVLGRPETEWQAERAKVETDGWGAQLLAVQDADGQWAGGTFLPAGFEAAEW